MTGTVHCVDDYIRVVQLEAEFWATLERNSYGELLRLMVPECRWFRGGRWRDGHEQIAASLAERPVGRVVRHSLSNLRVERQKERLICSYLIVAFSADSEAVTPPYPFSGPLLVADCRDLLLGRADGLFFSELYSEIRFLQQP